MTEHTLTTKKNMSTTKNFTSIHKKNKYISIIKIQTYLFRIVQIIQQREATTKKEVYYSFGAKEIYR